MIIPTAKARIAWFQQVFMLIDHAKTEVAIHCYYELGEIHLTIFAF